VDTASGRTDTIVQGKAEETGRAWEWFLASPGIQCYNRFIYDWKYPPFLWGGRRTAGCQRKAL